MVVFEEVNMYIPTDWSVNTQINRMDKRTQIIEAAIKVFAQKGLERGKIADIAKEAGIGKGTVYEYFRSKEEIFSAIEQAVMGEMSTAFEELFVSDISPTEKLIALMEESLEMMLQMGDALLIVTEIWAQAARGFWHGHSTTALATMYDDFREKIVAILKDGIVCGEFRSMSKDGVATLLMAFMDGLAWQYMLMKDENRFEKIKQEAIRSFMKGIEK
ncbi:MAG: TetR/AcrR family transcriptional regulator [Candidatus Marinimicrobia bacterium]|nr:TetR/AcrR family transcriptional regulator [Candidatus Neomarinimicrobiota bacterium]